MGATGWIRANHENAVLAAGWIQGTVGHDRCLGQAARGKTENRANRNVGARHAVPACSTDRNM